MKHRVV